MANNTLEARFACCAKTSAEWATNTTVPMKGEFAIELTGSTPKVKIGDGVNIFKDLPYITMTSEEINALITAYKIVVDSALSDTSENPVQNKVIKAELDKKVPTERTINGKPLTSNITINASDIGAISTDLLGQAGGIAELDSSGKIPSSQLPSYVDDVIDGYFFEDNFYKDESHTIGITGESDKIYVDVNTRKTYRYSGTLFVEISESLALGETSSTAFPGDKGKIAYEHSQQTHAPSDAEKNTLVGVQKNGTDVAIDPETRKANIIVPTKTSDLTNDSNFITKVDIQGAVTGTGTGSVINATAVNAMALYVSSGDVLILDGSF